MEIIDLIPTTDAERDYFKHKETHFEIAGCPTPCARDWKGSQGRSYRGVAADLPAVAAMCITPEEWAAKHGDAKKQDAPPESTPAPKDAPPVPYVENFLSKAEADALFELCKTLPHERERNLPYRTLRRRITYPAYSDAPQSRGSEDRVVPLVDAPPEIKTLAAKLSAHTGKPIVYLGVDGYENANDGMNFHRHEDDLKSGVDATVHVISLGEPRTIGIRKVGETGNGATFIPTHGSLYTLPHEMNATHEHSVLKNKVPCGLRIRIDCKHESPRLI